LSASENDEGQLVQQPRLQNEEQQLERLDQTILDIIAHPQKTKKTAAIGTLF